MGWGGVGWGLGGGLGRGKIITETPDFGGWVGGVGEWWWIRNKRNGLAH
jgi:hypothetical protein